MRRALRWTVRIVAGLLSVAVLAVAVVFVGLNTDAGRRLVERALPGLTGGMVTLSGLGGRFPEALRAGRVTVSDSRGVWLTADEISLRWSPMALVRDRLARVDDLRAARVVVARLPVSSPAQPPISSTAPFRLPVAIDVKAARVDRLEVAEGVAGTAASLGIDARGRASADLATVIVYLDATRTDSGDSYHAGLTREPAGNTVVVAIRERAAPLVATIAGVPGLGPITSDLTLGGPTDDLKVLGDLGAGPLYATVQGSIDLDHRAADVGLTLKADAMRPVDGVGWSAVSVEAHARGTPEQPDLSGTVRIADAEAGGVFAKSIAADLAGTSGKATLAGTIDGLRVPGPDPSLFAAAPVTVSADATLSAADRPVVFRIAAPRLTIDGRATTAGRLAGHATVGVPDFSPFSAVAGTALGGHATLSLDGDRADDGTVTAALDGTVALTAGPSPAPALLGDAAHVVAAMRVKGRDVTVQRLDVDGRAVRVRATGHTDGEAVAATVAAGLSDLAALAPSLAGNLDLTATADGTVTALGVTGKVSGEVGAPGVPRGPITADFSASGLPSAPVGNVSARGQLFAAPVDLAASVRRDADGTARLDLTRAAWKSASASAALSLPPGQTLPLGTADARVDNLDDLWPLVGQGLAGALTASLRSDPGRVHLAVDTRGLALPGAGAVARATLAADVADPLGKPVLDATFSAEGAKAAAGGGSVKITARGPEDTLALNVDATLSLSGQPARLASAATLNVTDKDTTVSSFQADWRGIPLRLLAPVKVSFADGVALDRLRVGVRQATLEVAGRVSPTLDVTVAARNLTPDLAAPFLPPGLGIDGRAQLDARLTGAPARPSGQVRAQASGIHMRNGPGSALPPAGLTATADLDGRSARVDARATTGKSTLALTGRAPLDPAGALDLRATGAVDLALLNPLIAADGRRVAGQASLDATVTGTASAPRIGGTLRLDRGEAQDVVQGLRLTAITGLFEARGNTVRVVSLTAAAGPGTISAAGTVGALAPGLPIDLTLTARRARPLASDRITVDLDADLSVRGQAVGDLRAAGSIKILRADIRIPEHLPASVPTLNVRRPGAPPPAPPSPRGGAGVSGGGVALALAIDAPGQIFVRGRGLDAELGGSLKIGGTISRPVPDGTFTLRRGQFSLAGQTLTFSKGEVGFASGSLTDPSIDFVASATNGATTANLEVSGTPSAPKITLSSTPPLPQDEVLAQLLFGRSAASLSPFELAQIAATLASLTGAGPGLGDPLNSLRSGLGLDRLSLGGGAGGTGTALNAGRYVAPGVYVGARQGLSGSGTQATVQVDLARGLKLEGAVGTGGGATANGTATTGSGADAGGSSVGLTYQFEY